ncbi:MAG: uracil-DNA glycosylase [Clostridium sp.]
MSYILNKSWSSLLKEEFSKDYYCKLMNLLNDEYKSKIIFPPREFLFEALNLTSYEEVKVVILGQDPYHGANQAHGLSFSVNPGIKIPPSLLNIYKELQNDLGFPIPNHGYLKSWAMQGVLLLNTSLTVIETSPNSHQKIGWSIFTDKIISLINDKETPVVFILWGNNAISKKSLITNKRHLILQSVHPSPLSARRGFFGSKPFSKANDFLSLNHLSPIDWRINNI